MIINKPKILFIGCNENQIPYLHEIKRRDFYVVGIDQNNDCPGKQFCDSFYKISYDDYDEMIRIGMQESFNKDCKVFTASSQFAHKGAAIFAEYFEINYPKEVSVDFCLDKTIYYSYFLKEKIPLPKTYFIQTFEEMEEIITNSKVSSFYLKSDFSKSPNYVYKINLENYKDKAVFWGRDRYLKNNYILQEEFFGISLRINVFGDRYNVIDFISGEKTNSFDHLLLKFGVINVLKSIIHFLGMTHWLIKFDVIVNERSFVVIDIGLDPPSRMRRIYLKSNINFFKHYVNQYIDKNISFPNLKD